MTTKTKFVLNVTPTNIDDSTLGPEVAVFELSPESKKRILDLQRAVKVLGVTSITDLKLSPEFYIRDNTVMEGYREPEDCFERDQCDIELVTLHVESGYFYWTCEARNQGVRFRTDDIGIKDITDRNFDLATAKVDPYKALDLVEASITVGSLIHDEGIRQVALDEIRAALLGAGKFRVAVISEGGIVQAVVSDHLGVINNLQFAYIDYDTEEAETDTLGVVHNTYTGTSVEAIISKVDIEPTKIDLDKIFNA